MAPHTLTRSLIPSATPPLDLAPLAGDTIYSIPVPGPGQENLRDGYPRYGYWTASPLAGNGTFGFGQTDDGFTWKALPSPQMLPEPIGAELGAVEYVRPGLYVAILGYGWPRTMLAYTAESPVGPFTRSPRNVNFLNGSCYYARFFRGALPEQELLVTHQTWDNHGSHYSYVDEKRDGREGDRETGTETRETGETGETGETRETRETGTESRETRERQERDERETRDERRERRERDERETERDERDEKGERRRERERVP